MKSILVLGSGQLGLMLAQAGARLGLTVDRLDIDLNLTGDQHKPLADLLPGSSGSRFPVNDLASLATYDSITAEREHLPNSTLIEHLTHTHAWQHQRSFQKLAHRTRQKQLLDQLNIPTAPWCPLNHPQDLINAQQAINPKLVIKTTQGGYDGRGQWRTPQDPTQDNLQNNPQIPQELWGQLIAESFIPFKQEISMIGARNQQGQLCFLPMSFNHHSDGILRFSIAGSDLKIPKQGALQQQAKTYLSKLMTALDHSGVMAMECFVTDQETLVVNEIAPRVHNSGHWSQLGAEKSQFDLHLYALLNLPFPTFINTQPTLMLNLIGCEFNPQWLILTHVQCYWYGKSWRKNRKLGHLNIAVNDDIKNTANTLMQHLDLEHQSFLKIALSHLET